MLLFVILFRFLYFPQSTILTPPPGAIVSLWFMIVAVNWLFHYLYSLTPMPFLKLLDLVTLEILHTETRVYITKFGKGSFMYY